MVTAGDAPPVRIAVDIGGTFTDLQIFDARSGAITSLKTPTTPEDPSIGLMTGIKAAAARDGFALGDIGYLLHGTTIATNAVLERKLPRGALVTTARFEDVVEIGRHYRREIYALNPAGAAQPHPPRPAHRRRGAHKSRRQRRDAPHRGGPRGARDRSSMALTSRPSPSACSTPTSIRSTRAAWPSILRRPGLR